MLGSPVFKRALERDGFQESTRNKSDGLYHISASDWDAEAFLTIMQVIHGRNRQVPRTITLEMFTKIAVIEDYYQFGEALDVFRDIWLENLRETGVPKTFCREVMLWICAAWTFDAQEQFREATMVATRHSKTSIDSLGLPIPHRVLGMQWTFFGGTGFDRQQMKSNRSDTKPSKTSFRVYTDCSKCIATLPMFVLPIIPCLSNVDHFYSGL